MTEKALFTIGLFIGMFDSLGNILLIKRDQEPYFGKYELPGGAIRTDHIFSDERMIRYILDERVIAKTGLTAFNGIQRMPAMYPAINGNDIAFAIIFGPTSQVPKKGESIFVSPDELDDLAENKDLVSGKKRMYRMCLRMFVSRDCPNPEYRRKAAKTLSCL